MVMFPFAFADPGDLCFEQANAVSQCNFIDGPLEALIIPFTAIFGDWFFPIVWGIILGVLWLKTQSNELVGVVGLMVSTTIATFYEPARQVAVLLFLISLGIALYKSIVFRLENPHT